MSIRLIAADVDGTLTHTASQVSERNLRAIRSARENGVFFTIATGRGIAASRRLIRLLDIDGPVILFGGAMVMDAASEERLLMHTLDPELVRDILEYAHFLGRHAQIYLEDRVCFEKETAFSKCYTSFADLPYTVDPDIRKKRFTGVPKVLVYAEPDAEDEVRAKLTERFSGMAGVSRSQPGYIEINAPSATKGNALAWVAERMGIGRDEVAAIGDSYLDVDMIAWAGTGVCVANGVPDAIASADVIAPDCAEDGVARYIEQILGNGRE